MYFRIGLQEEFDPAVSELNSQGGGEVMIVNKTCLKKNGVTYKRLLRLFVSGAGKLTVIYLAFL